MSCWGGPSESVLPLLPFFILIPPLSLICGVAAAMNVVTTHVTHYTWHITRNILHVTRDTCYLRPSPPRPRPRDRGARAPGGQSSSCWSSWTLLLAYLADPVRVRMFYCVQYIASVCLSSCQRLLDISIKYTLIIWIGYFEGGGGIKLHNMQHFSVLHFSSILSSFYANVIALKCAMTLFFLHPHLQNILNLILHDRLIPDLWIFGHKALSIFRLQQGQKSTSKYVNFLLNQPEPKQMLVLFEVTWKETACVEFWGPVARGRGRILSTYLQTEDCVCLRDRVETLVLGAHFKRPQVPAYGWCHAPGSAPISRSPWQWHWASVWCPHTQPMHTFAHSLYTVL